MGSDFRRGHPVYIDQHLPKEAKTQWKDVVIAWTEYKMDYDMVPQTWLIECLKINKICNKIINFITNVMENWRVELIEGCQTRAVEEFQKVIIRRSFLSHLLFVIAMM